MNKLEKAKEIIRENFEYAGLGGIIFYESSRWYKVCKV